ncbi:MAG: hypothetical protein JJT90_06605 [Ectothiorhodospiraceae bacterium]|nr:hypothetical protein [Ectothiorhodospiraceae bacterium]
MATTEVASEVTGSVWKVELEEGDHVDEGSVIMILESMKMEIPVEAPVAGKLVDVRVSPGESVEEDQVVCVIQS